MDRQRNRLLNYFEQKNQHQQHIPQGVAPLIERAVHEELTGLILMWLKQSKDAKAQQQVPEETIAHIVGWAIFGVVIEWSQAETAISAEQMTDDILLVIMEGVARVAPRALSD